MDFEVPIEGTRGMTVNFLASSPAGVIRVYMSFWRPSRLPDKATVCQDHNLILLHVISGSGRYEDVNGVSCDLRPGVFLQRMPGVKHQIVRNDGEPWWEFAVRLSRPLFDRLFELGMIRDQVVLTPGMDAMMFAYLRDTITRLKGIPVTDSPRVLLEFQNFLQHIYSRERLGHRDIELLQSIEKACEILSQRLPQRVVMPDVAHEIGLGYHHFRKIFVEHIGMSPKEYRVSRRIERSQELILEGKMGLADIAEHLGYTDQAAFAKQFKRVTGMTPGAYRTSW